MEKLTVTHDLHFRGQLRKFLANTLPLSHRSGCNLLGMFNKTVTTLDPAADEDNKHQQGRIYRNFWNLQKQFADPLSVSSPKWPNSKSTLDF